MIIIPGELRLQHIAVDHLAIGLLQGEKEQDSVTDRLSIGNLASRLYKGIHVSRPNLRITTASVKSLANDRPCHAVDLTQALVGLNPPRQFHFRVGRTTRDQQQAGHPGKKSLDFHFLDNSCFPRK